MRNLFKAVALVLVVAVFGVGFAGCGAKKASGKVKIGIIPFVEHPVYTECVNGFKAGLVELGIDAEVDVQNAAGDVNIATTIAQNMVSKKYDIIVPISTLVAQAVQAAAEGTDIPVIFIGVSEPVEAGIVDENGKTVYNITGVADGFNAVKQFELIKKYLPDAKRLGILYNPAEANAVKQVGDLEKVVNQNGLTLKKVTANATSEVSLALDSLLPQIDVLVGVMENLGLSAADLIVSKTLERKIPYVVSYTEQIDKGALVGYSYKYYELSKQAASMVDKVLKGTKIVNIPVELGNETEVSVNKGSAEKLGIDIGKFDGATIVE